jgi:hypothetical protein
MTTNSTRNAVILHLPEISRNVKNKKREYLRDKNVEHDTARTRISEMCNKA